MNLLKQRRPAGLTQLVVVTGDHKKFSFLLPPSKFISRQLIDLGINMKGLEDDISLKKKLDALEQQFDQVQQF